MGRPSVAPCIRAGSPAITLVKQVRENPSAAAQRTFMAVRSPSGVVKSAFALGAASMGVNQRGNNPAFPISFGWGGRGRKPVYPVGDEGSHFGKSTSGTGNTSDTVLSVQPVHLTRLPEAD